ncbi:MAG TPA: magnesium transporter [Rhodospirillaceae bacterium]|nr:magnesium transporter [Rhodospirillaceae bacterium]
MSDTPSADAYLLSDLIGGKVRLNGKAIGKLADIIITDAAKAAEVTHLLIHRPYGYKSLMVPWEKVEHLAPNGQVTLSGIEATRYEGEPHEGQVCLRDHLLDKKVLDCDDDEVEVVYDIKLMANNRRLFVTDVDCSRAGFLRRIGLKRLSNFIRAVAAKINEDTIPWSYVQQLPSNMGSFKGNVKLNLLKDKLPEIHPVDLADILEELDHEHRMAIFNELDTEHASDTLEEVEPRVQRELVSSLSIERTAELVNEMTPAQAADILAALPASEVDDILEHVDAPEAAKIHALIDRHEEQIANYATSHYITFSPETSVGEVMGKYRDVARDADVVMYVYVIDGKGVLVGVVDIKEILLANLHDKLCDIMTTNTVALEESSTVAEASQLFARYGFRAIPIIGEGEVLKGVIPYRDVMQLSHHFV